MLNLNTSIELDLPAVDDNGPAENIFKGVHAASEFQEEVWLLGDAVVGPTDELDVGHLSLSVFVPLGTRNDTQYTTH